ncbi:MAG: VCBS repeat-containing protein [Acidobacteriota bacterium]
MTHRMFEQPLLAISLGLLATCWLASDAEARRERLDLQHTSIDLPGSPATILTPDLDGDGLRDLVVLVVYTEWDQLAVEETTEMDDIEGLIEVMTIVPALADRRELHVFLGVAAGGYRAVPHLELDRGLLALEDGPPAAPVVALTDAGLSALRLDGEQLSFEPLFEDPPVLAGSGTFVPRLGLGRHLDDDGRLDLIFPARDGAVVHLADAEGYRPATSRLALPTDRRQAGRRLIRHYPLPEVRDVDGDRQLDLVFRDDEEDQLAFFVLGNLSSGRFSRPIGPLTLPPPCPESDPECPSADEELVYFGDIDGDGRAEYVSQQGLEEDDAGFRQEMREAKRPPYRYRLYRSDERLAPATEPYQTFDALGYTFENSEADEGQGNVSIPGGFHDLDGDGRQDLLALTLDFSIMQVMRIMTLKQISIGLDFHVYCQQPDGDFQQVQGLDLSGRFKVDINDLKVHQLSFFDGDFDGDGKADFVQLGRGRNVTIHRGREGCRYASNPDLTLRLKEEPRNVALVRIDDLDADGFSDLLIVQPNRVKEPGVTPPVRLELYRSQQAVGR